MNLKSRIDDLEVFMNSACDNDGEAENIVRHLAPLTGLSEDEFVNIWIEKCHRMPLTLMCMFTLMKNMQERRVELGMSEIIEWPEGLSLDASHEEILERYRSDSIQRTVRSNPPDS